MRKILFINSAANFSSTGKIVEQIGERAEKDEWITYIIHSSRYNYETKLCDIRCYSSISEKLHYLYSYFFDSHGLGSIITTKIMLMKIKEINPDIIHLHNIHGYYLNYPLLFRYLKKINKPVIWTFHDCWPITGHCAYFDLANCEKWKTLCRNCELKNTYPKSVLFDRSKRNYKLKKKYFTSLKNVTLVPVSTWLKNILSESYLNKYPQIVIHNGIDLQAFKPSRKDLRGELDLNNSFIILGVASKWGDEGRINSFLQLRKMLSGNYIIILIGLSPEQILEMPDGIIGIERTNSSDELASYYSMADVFANPTMQDNFPTTNLEALACGTPVITYKTGGSPEAIDEKTGIVVERGNVDELKKAVLIIENKLKAGNKDGIYGRETCRRRAVEHFNKYERYQDYIDLYNSLIGRK